MMITIFTPVIKINYVQIDRPILPLIVMLEFGYSLYYWFFEDAKSFHQLKFVFLLGQVETFKFGTEEMYNVFFS